MASRHFIGLPIVSWPERDGALWLQGTAPADPFDKPGAGANWRPATKAAVEKAYGFALRWLRQNGALDQHVSPAERWTPDRLRAYIRDLSLHLRPATTRHRVVHLERALAVVAPDADRALFRIAARNLQKPADRSRKRARLQEPAALIALGVQLMADADAGVRNNARHNATLFQLGLQIALLAMCPLRMRNLTNIRIGLNLVKEGDAWWLLFSGEETKTKQPLEERFPETLCDALDRYLAVYRPVLAGTRYRGDWLWVGYRFVPQNQHSLQLAIVRATQRRFGKSINPHLFRDCAATAIALHDPSAVHIAAAVLGHSTLATAERHYNLASSVEAGRSYNRVIQMRRAGRAHRQWHSRRRLTLGQK